MEPQPAGSSRRYGWRRQTYPGLHPLHQERTRPEKCLKTFANCTQPVPLYQFWLEQIFEQVRRPRDDGTAAANHDRALHQFRMP